ncbi:MAG: CPBP family intramembrane metalloprotease [Propionibacterium sp.]|jgi:CAAX amino protease|nr:CPBP family intramembrane metalloprotease [Propionibacterium sp.]
MISQSSKKFSQSELPQEPPRAPGWLRITLVFAAFFIAASSPMLLYYFLVPLREGLLSESVLIKAGPYIVVSAVVCVTYLLFTFLLTRYADLRPLRVLGMALGCRAGIALLVGTGISVAVVCLVAFGYRIFGLTVALPPADPTIPWWVVGIGFLVDFARAYLLQGIGEEAIMRGYVLQSFSDHPKRAVWISVIVFTVPHILSENGQQDVLGVVVYLAIPFSFGLVAAYLSLIMRTVWAGIGIHGGCHLASSIASGMGVDLTDLVFWALVGALYIIVALVLAAKIGEQRWAEVAARGPFALPCRSDRKPQAPRRSIYCAPVSRSSP